MTLNKQHEELKKLLVSSPVRGCIRSLEKHHRLLPHLPYKIVTILVKLLPYFVIAGIVISIYQLLMNFRFIIVAIERPEILPSVLAIVYLSLRFVLQLLSLYLLYKALPEIREKRELGWIYLLWNEAANVLFAILEMIHGSSVSAGTIVLSSLVALYVLLEVKPRFDRSYSYPKLARNNS